MNAKQRETLQQHRTFLTRNIVWSSELASKLVSHGIITEAILTDIQVVAGGKSPKSPVCKLLEVLPLRGSGMYEKFCQVLQLHGHPFIADFLRDEENTDDSKADISGLYQRVPLLDKLLKEDDKKAIGVYFNEKIKESNLKGLWSKEAVAREKDKAIEAKRKQLEDAFENEAKERQFRENIQKLEKQIQDYRNDIIELKSQMNYMKTQYQDNEVKYKSEFGVQMKFSMANENALRRADDKYRKCEDALSELQAKLQDILKAPPRNTEKDQIALAEFPFAFVLKDFQDMVEKYNKLLAIEKQYDNLLDERNYILSHLGFHAKEGEEKPSLLTAYRDFAVKTDEDMSDLKQKLNAHYEMIEGQQSKIAHLNEEVEKQSHAGKMKAAGSVWQNAMLGVMRKQLNDVKHDNRIKDTKIRNLEGEINKLKQRLAETEAARRAAGMDSVTPRQQPMLTHNVDNGMVSAPSSSTDEDETRSKSRRNTLLPPLGGGGRILFQTADITFSPNVAPKKSKGRPLGTLGRQEQPNKYSSSVPDGLVSQQMRLENKAKLNHMMNMGQLKTLHNKNTMHITFSPNVAPKKSKGRPLGTLGRQEQPNKYSSSVPDGLVSQQMRLENKAKLNHMMNTGQLKTLHNKNVR